jgi:hypothetical protein
MEGEEIKVSLLKQKKTNVTVDVILCIAAVVFLCLSCVFIFP